MQFLRTMARQGEYAQYRRTFPQPGQGTLVARMAKADPALKRRVYMKSGSMNGVRCFCGYVTPADGRNENTIVFSLMINNATATSAALNPVIDQLLTAIASQ
jgi:D-alanyl-D-alanine carboxypeptidase/D-alanyl-D-alanine-endopeptidase (penicillin-binding protein 4)